MNVSDLRVGMRRVDITVKVLEISEVREVTSRYDGKMHRVATAVVSDDTGSIKLAAMNAGEATVPVKLRVLPIKLQEDPEKIYGIYYRHPLDGWARAPDEVSKAYWLRKAELEHQDMVAQGDKSTTGIKLDVSRLIWSGRCRAACRRVPRSGGPPPRNRPRFPGHP